MTHWQDSQGFQRVSADGTGPNSGRMSRKGISSLIPASQPERGVGLKGWGMELGMAWVPCSPRAAYPSSVSIPAAVTCLRSLSQAGEGRTGIYRPLCLARGAPTTQHQTSVRGPLKLQDLASLPCLLDPGE